MNKLSWERILTLIDEGLRSIVLTLLVAGVCSLPGAWTLDVSAAVELYQPLRMLLVVTEGN